MKKWIGGLLAALMLSNVINTPAFASETMEPQVKVKLVNYIGNQKQLTIHPTGEFLVEGTNIHLTSDKTYTVKYDNNSIKLLDGTSILYSTSDLDLEPFHENDYLSINNRAYLGSFDFIPENSAYVRPINKIYMEDYLKGVVPFEMMGSWNREALKAQAVAARTYAYSKLGMTIDDTINYQVYGGFDWYPNATAAVEETKGQVLTYKNELISAVYSASNGGKTEANANVWGGTPAAYLPIKDDPFDAKIPWSISIKKVEIDPTVTVWTSMKETDTTITNNIKTWMSSNGFAGKEIKITSIPVLALYSPTTGGRVSKGDITVNFYTKDAVDINGKYIPQQLVFQNVAASQIRAMVGIQNMLSYLVTNQTFTNDSITITGLGNGHGVGMSQWGAKNRADSGQTYRDILSFYYDGTSIDTKYSQRAAFVVPAADTSAGVTVSPTTVQQSMQQTTTTVDTTVPVLDGWMYSNNQWYFHKNNVKQVGWIYSGSKWYYLDNIGIMKTGWIYVGGKWYYLDNAGVMKTGWIYLAGKWYYLNDNGDMRTGWLLYQNNWYFLNDSGAMATGWIYTGGKWYYLYGTGIMAHDTYIGKYKLSHSGAWI